MPPHARRPQPGRLPRGGRRRARDLERVPDATAATEVVERRSALSGAADADARRGLAARRARGLARERPGARVGAGRDRGARRLGARDHEPRLARAQGAAARSGERHRDQRLGSRPARPATRAQPRAFLQAGGGPGRLPLRRAPLAADRRHRRGRSARGCSPRAGPRRRARARGRARPDPRERGEIDGRLAAGGRGPQPQPRGGADRGARGGDRGRPGRRSARRRCSRPWPRGAFAT